jgi:hypothetical protein
MAVAGSTGAADEDVPQEFSSLLPLKFHLLVAGPRWRFGPGLAVPRSARFIFRGECAVSRAPLPVAMRDCACAPCNYDGSALFFAVCGWRPCGDGFSRRAAGSPNLPADQRRSDCQCRAHRSDPGISGGAPFRALGLAEAHGTIEPGLRYRLCQGCAFYSFQPSSLCTDQLN